MNRIDIPDEAWTISKKIFYLTEVEKRSILEILDLGRNSEEINEDMKTMREWLEKQPHLPHTIDDIRLLHFIKLNKFRLEKVKRKLDMYYSLRNFMPELFENREPKAKNIQDIMKEVHIIIMPRVTAEFGRILICKVLPEVSDDINSIDALKYLLMILDLRFIFDLCTSEILIFDYSHVRLGHILKLNLVAVKIGVLYIKNAISSRAKGIHFYKMPNYCTPALNIAKSMVKSKLKDRVFLHKDLESLHGAVPRQYLPSDYGGPERSVNDLHVEWKHLLELMNDWFLKEGNKKSNESLRQEPLEYNEIFGHDGTFRQLQID